MVCSYTSSVYLGLLCFSSIFYLFNFCFLLLHSFPDCLQRLFYGFREDLYLGKLPIDMRVERIRNPLFPSPNFNRNKFKKQNILTILFYIFICFFPNTHTCKHFFKEFFFFNILGKSYTFCP